MSQLTPKHILENQILLKLYKIFNSTEINPLIVPTLSQSPQCIDISNEQILEQIYYHFI